MADTGIIRNRAKIVGTIAGAGVAAHRGERPRLLALPLGLLRRAADPGQPPQPRRHRHRDGGVAAHRQGPEGGRLLLLRADDHPCLHAGGGDGERPPHRVPPPRGLRRPQRGMSAPRRRSRRGRGSGCSPGGGSTCSIRLPSTSRSRTSPTARPRRPLERADGGAARLLGGAAQLLVEGIGRHLDPPAPPPTAWNSCCTTRRNTWWGHHLTAQGGDRRCLPGVEKRLLAAVRQRFGIPAPSPALTRRVKRADRIAAHLEAVRLAVFPRRSRPLFRPAPALPEAVLTLADPWPTADAQTRFLTRRFGAGAADGIPKGEPFGGCRAAPRYGALRAATSPARWRPRRPWCRPWPRRRGPRPGRPSPAGGVGTLAASADFSGGACGASFARAPSVPVTPSPLRLAAVPCPLVFAEMASRVSAVTLPDRASICWAQGEA